MDAGKASLQHPHLIGARTTDLSEVADATPGMAPFPGSQGLQPSGAFEDLAFYRLEYPFVPIMPLPTFIKTKVLVANVASNIEIPSGCALAILKSNGNFWCSWQGNATIPVAGSSIYDDAISSGVYNPVDMMFYVKNISQLSFISDNPVTVQFLGWSMITSGLGGVDNRNR